MVEMSLSYFGMLRREAMRGFVILMIQFGCVKSDSEGDSGVLILAPYDWKVAGNHSGIGSDYGFCVAISPTDRQLKD
jgi:hypothetical protein